MTFSGPLIVIEDDPDDQEMIKRVLAKMELPNDLIFFSDGEQALKYFRSTTDKPFLIISDINMPLINGLDLKRAIQADENLQKKCYPFVFLTTTASASQVIQAYNLTVEGFFAKGQSYEELKETLRSIVTYWKGAHHPYSS